MGRHSLLHSVHRQRGGGVPEKRKWKNCSLKKDLAAATMIDNHLRLGNFQRFDEFLEL
jgi:hypothetical protein